MTGDFPVGHAASMNGQPGDILPADWDLLRVLDRAILRLRPEWRDVILLRFYGGKSRRQAARELGLPAGVVRERESQALSAMCRFCHRRGTNLSEDVTGVLLEVAFSVPAPAHLVERITAAASVRRFADLGDSRD